ncbi:MAG: ribosomal L7Ae/L30e/S12e/Gadd45 family protein [Oscillospiraceae bacterium]|jgi:large subunit ribosomal protein L7A|nr:ribosomal L7Ae/L30e/S12e/Gadd45 family protein [Oscillospiraceae bacterium]
MLDLLARAPAKTAGSKQVLRALREGRLKTAYIARDADPFVTRPVADACERAGVSVIEVDYMKALGKACALSVGAASAGILKG